jgi:hypothetical protein
VVSLDASRLARNNRDWHQLLELCSVFGVLIADGERLYDPRAYHDRLLLGLSGIMSEAELHQIRMRLHQGERQKASRGELRLPLPAGLAHNRAGLIILNPDEEVQARLLLVFVQRHPTRAPQACLNVCDIQRKQNKRFYGRLRHVRRMLTAVVVPPDGTKIAVGRLVFRSADLPLRTTSCDHCTHAVQSPFSTVGYFGRPQGANRACFLTEGDHRFSGATADVRRSQCTIFRSGGAFLVLVTLMRIGILRDALPADSARALRWPFARRVLGSAKKEQGHRLSRRSSPLRDHFAGSGQERSGTVRPSALRS